VVSDLFSLSYTQISGDLPVDVCVDVPEISTIRGVRECQSWCTFSCSLDLMKAFRISLEVHVNGTYKWSIHSALSPMSSSHPYKLLESILLELTFRNIDILEEFAKKFQGLHWAGEMSVDIPRELILGQLPKLWGLCRKARGSRCLHRNGRARSFAMRRT